MWFYRLFAGVSYKPNGDFFCVFDEAQMPVDSQRSRAAVGNPVQIRPGIESRAFVCSVGVAVGQ